MLKTLFQQEYMRRGIMTVNCHNLCLAHTAEIVDRLLAAHVRGDDIVSEVSMAKFWTSDLQKKVAAECLQLFGGYGFMDEYPISRDYADSAVQSIYAGSNEIMKVIIARRLGLE